MAFMLQLPVRFRFCRRDDLPALEWMGLHTRDRHIIKAAFAAQEQGDMLMLLADGNGFPVGQVWMDFAERGDRECPHFWAVRVFPPLQRAGLGERLMQEAERLAGERGARRCELSVERENPTARRFYEKLGYGPADHQPQAIASPFETPSTPDERLLLRKALPAPCAAEARS